MNEASLRSKMQDVIGLFSSEIAGIRTGRAHASLVEDIKVPAYGGTQELRIQELANIKVTDPQTIVIDPWDKSIIGDIKKGILAANVGLNPAIDGQIIRIALPPLTTQDREKYARLLDTKIESSKIMLRQVRGEAVKEIKKQLEDKVITEDEKFRQEELLQKITDEFTDKIEKLGQNKKQELLEI